MKGSSEKILIVMPNWIGDCLMALPLARILKEQLKAAYVGVLVHKRTETLFKGHPYIDYIIAYRDKEGFGLRLRTICSLAGIGFNTAFIFKPSLTKSLICRFSGIRYIIGPVSDKFNLINKPVSILPGSHKMDTYLGLARGLGLDPQGYLPKFFITPKDRAGADKIMDKIPSGKVKVVIHPKANWPPKMWPPEYFARLADRLIEELGVFIIISGSAEDIPLAKKIKTMMRNTPFIIAGKTDLKQTAAVLVRCNLFISADTGIMHLAASLGLSFIALFGPTDPLATLPKTESRYRLLFKNQACKVPCYKIDCKDNECMREITVDDVIEEVKSLLL
jgi:lipopolysaccharide heptosyltransferase II